MKRLALLIVILAILGAGGTLTALTSGSGMTANSIPGAKIQCTDPGCSVFMAEPWEAGQLILLTGFILFNMIGIGATLALVFWFLSKGVANAKANTPVPRPEAPRTP